MILYNSSTRSKDEFVPKGEQVAIYVCGITPYDTTHIGHAFTYASTDILIRYLEYLGLEVRYVQNVTDIDDDILRRASEVGENWRALGNRWTAHYIEDMIALNVRPPDVFPRATDVITDIVSEVRGLQDAGLAYHAGSSVYFDIDAWDQFGRFVGHDNAGMLKLANERGNIPNDPNKRNPLDFVLWQGRAPGEPSWESPWGPGRPGWHIECSTMAGKFLGQTIDIHGGGADLAFPHHDAEIAQVESVSQGQPFSRFWMHVAMVEYGGEKMSKSLGNLVMIRDLLQEFDADAIRLYLGSHHYRVAWEYNQPDLIRAGEDVHLLKRALAVSSGHQSPISADVESARFEQAMGDDLNSPEAIEALLALARRVTEAPEGQVDVRPAQQSLLRMARVLGLLLGVTLQEDRVVDGWRRHLTRFKE